MMNKWLQKASSVVSSIKNSNSRVTEDADVMIGIPPEVAPTEIDRDAPVVRLRTSNLDLIVVPQSAIDAIDDAPHLLCEAVSDFVDYLIHVGHYSREELPLEAMQILHANDFYHQVCHGGHSQFVGNSLSILSAATQDVTSTILEMGHSGYHKLACEMATWIATHPEQAKQQTGAAGGIADELAALDMPFFALDAAEPFQSLLADWIVGLDIVLAVSDDQIARVREGIVLMADKIEPREPARDIARFDHMLSDPLHLGLAHAGGSIKDPLIAISVGTKMDVQGKEMTCWMVAATGGKRWGVINETGAALMEYIEGSLHEAPNDQDHQKSPKVGGVIASVTQEQINVARQIAAQTKAAAAIEMLLGRLDRKITADYLSVRSAGLGKDNLTGASIYVVANNATEAFSVLVTSEGAKLLEEPTHKVLVKVTRAQIDAHASAYGLAIAA